MGEKGRALTFALCRASSWLASTKRCMMVGGEGVLEAALGRGGCGGGAAMLVRWLVGDADRERRWRARL